MFQVGECGQAAARAHGQRLPAPPQDAAGAGEGHAARGREAAARAERPLLRLGARHQRPRRPGRAPPAGFGGELRRRGDLRQTWQPLRRGRGGTRDFCRKDRCEEGTPSQPAGRLAR
jgi:hypothetical protein